MKLDDIEVGAEYAIGTHSYRTRAQVLQIGYPPAALRSDGTPPRGTPRQVEVQPLDAETGEPATRTIGGDTVSIGPKWVHTRDVAEPWAPYAARRAREAVAKAERDREQQQTLDELRAALDAAGLGQVLDARKSFRGASIALATLSPDDARRVAERLQALVASADDLAAFVEGEYGGPGDAAAARRGGGS